MSEKSGFNGYGDHTASKPLSSNVSPFPLPLKEANARFNSL